MPRSDQSLPGTPITEKPARCPDQIKAGLWPGGKAKHSWQGSPAWASPGLQGPLGKPPATWKADAARSHIYSPWPLASSFPHLARLSHLSEGHCAEEAGLRHLKPPPARLPAFLPGRGTGQLTQYSQARGGFISLTNAHSANQTGPRLPEAHRPPPAMLTRVPHGGHTAGGQWFLMKRSS